jgi:hypothetical protein
MPHEFFDQKGIKPVDAWPAVEPFAHICGNTFSPRDADQVGNEAVIAVAVNRRRQAHDRRPNAPFRQRFGRRFRGAWIGGGDRRSGILFRGEPLSRHHRH